MGLFYPKYEVRMCGGILLRKLDKNEIGIDGREIVNKFQ